MILGVLTDLGRGLASYAFWVKALVGWSSSKN